MKKIIVIMLAVIMVFAVVGCNATNNNRNQGEEQKPANTMKLIVENSSNDINANNVDIDELHGNTLIDVLTYCRIDYYYAEGDFVELDKLVSRVDEEDNAHLIYIYTSLEKYQDTTEYVRVMNYENTVLKTINCYPTKVVVEAGMIIYIRDEIV